jgi:hypothetical protein
MASGVWFRATFRKRARKRRNRNNMVGHPTQRDAWPLSLTASAAQPAVVAKFARDLDHRVF